MDRAQIAKLGKKFNVKEKRRKSWKPPLDKNENPFNFNNTRVNNDDINISVISNILTQFENANIKTKLDIFNFDVQMDVFISMFPEKVRLPLTSKILGVFQVKSSKTIIGLKPRDLLNTIVDNKIKVFEILYLMQIDKEFKNYNLPDTILFRFAKALSTKCNKIGFIKGDAIPSSFGTIQYINFMYVIINKILLSITSDISAGTEPTGEIDKTTESVKQTEVVKPVVPELPKEEVKQCNNSVGPKNLGPSNSINIANSIGKLKFDYGINQTNLISKLKPFISSDSPLKFTNSPLKINDKINIYWDKDIPELLGKSRNKYFIQLDVPDTTIPFIGSIFGMTELKPIFANNTNFNSICSEIKPGSIINDVKVIGYKFKDTEITYERFKEEVVKCQLFRMNFSVICECLVCGEKMVYKFQSFINRIQENAIGCMKCTRTLTAQNLLIIAEILTAFDTLGISMQDIMIKNFSDFKLEDSTKNGLSKVLASATCSCGRVVRGADLALLFERDTYKVNCNKHSCSPFPNNTYKLIFTVWNYPIWENEHYKKLGETTVKNSQNNMLAALQNYGKSKIENVNKDGDKNMENASGSMVRPVEMNVPESIVGRSFTNEDIGATINGLSIDKNEPVVQVPRVVEVIPSMPSMPKTMEESMIPDPILREEFFKKFEHPSFSCKIFAYIPELKLYSGMLNAVNSQAAKVCNWDSLGKLQDDNLTDVGKFSFVRKDLLIIKNNDLNSVIKGMLDFGGNPTIPNGELDREDLFELKMGFAQLVVAKLNKNK